MTTYRILTPVFIPTGRPVPNSDKEWHRVVWLERGIASSMEEAKTITACPVLEEVRVH